MHRVSFLHVQLSGKAVFGDHAHVNESGVEDEGKIGIKKLRGQLFAFLEYTDGAESQNRVGQHDDQSPAELLTEKESVAPQKLQNEQAEKGVVVFGKFNSRQAQNQHHESGTEQNVGHHPTDKVKRIAGDNVGMKNKMIPFIDAFGYEKF